MYEGLATSNIPSRSRHFYQDRRTPSRARHKNISHRCNSALPLMAFADPTWIQKTRRWRKWQICKAQKREEADEVTSNEKCWLRVSISTSLCSEIKKYIWLNIPDSDDVEPVYFFCSCLASVRKSWNENKKENSVGSPLRLRDISVPRLESSWWNRSAFRTQSHWPWGFFRSMVWNYKHETEGLATSEPPD
jgi:hypothetical protein